MAKELSLKLANGQKEAAPRLPASKPNAIIIGKPAAASAKSDKTATSHCWQIMDGASIAARYCPLFAVRGKLRQKAFGSFVTQADGAIAGLDGLVAISPLKKRKRKIVPGGGKTWLLSQ